jgi:hypothetical protein
MTDIQEFTTRYAVLDGAKRNIVRVILWEISKKTEKGLCGCVHTTSCCVETHILPLLTLLSSSIHISNINYIYADTTKKQYTFSWTLGDFVVPEFIIQESNAQRMLAEQEQPFSTKNLFPCFDTKHECPFVYAPDWRFFSDRVVLCVSRRSHLTANEPTLMGFVLTDGRKITESQLDHLAEIEPEMRHYVRTTIINVSQRTAEHHNQDKYTDITHLIDRSMLHINFKDRIPSDKYVVAVLVPHRYSSLWKNCPNYDIPYKSPLLSNSTDKGAVLAGPNKLPFMMNPLGDAIIVLNE